MKQVFFSLFLNFILLNCFSQKNESPPLPPNPKNNKYSNKKPIKIIEVIEEKETKVEPKEIYPVNFLTEKKNLEYFSNIDSKIKSLDTTISLEEILNKKYYLFIENTVNPYVLDSLAFLGYNLNEKGKYIEAIDVLKELLKLSPLSISAYKELGFAYNKLGNDKDAKNYFSYMIILNEVISKIRFYGGDIILNHIFEGVSFMESKYKCYPDKQYKMLTRNGEDGLVLECLHQKLLLNISNYNKYK